MSDSSGALELFPNEGGCCMAENMLGPISPSRGVAFEILER